MIESVNLLDIKSFFMLLLLINGIKRNFVFGGRKWVGSGECGYMEWLKRTIEVERISEGDCI